MSTQDEQLRVLAQLEALRQSGDRRAWAKARRLAIVAECCPRTPLVEVMETSPESVLVRQISYGHADIADTERKPWSGTRQGDRGFVWLSAFEDMAARGAAQFIPCRHRRWKIPASSVVELRGRHTEPLPDNRGHSR